ncbi:lipopolysaccharide transport periplasmic protein LptA [Aliidiomarina soli]|uniref:Lipopolysaccharide export system protein LptA n=1 Tax=Aliidiomarina soli TaxID=1928574 RepID=A0A432WJN6_9GAMM|nr:lipopolysaccharide transport periplasmic protein LptA [Aliidiomarina soli]RUO34026.1 lipopolysaccharide transport periplasmic protein LptA [Aliidiomarina soli]
MCKLSISLSVALSSLLISAIAWADVEYDSQQPIKVEADHEELDLRANRLTFRDNVIITQGSLRITADLLEVEGDNDAELGQGEVFVATGSPATYQQTVDEGVTVNAHANEIRFDSRRRVLTLTGSAEMRESGNQVTAERITYYVDELRATAERSEDSDERVRSIFQPRSNNSSQNEQNNGDS